MTNEQLLTHLKQFITATVSGEVGFLRRELLYEVDSSRGSLKRDIHELRNELKRDTNSLRGELKAGIDRLDQKLDSVQVAIAETLTHGVDVVAIQDDEQRSA